MRLRTETTAKFVAMADRLMRLKSSRERSSSYHHAGHITASGGQTYVYRNRAFPHDRLRNISITYAVQLSLSRAHDFLPFSRFSPLGEWLSDDVRQPFAVRLVRSLRTFRISINRQIVWVTARRILAVSRIRGRLNVAKRKRDVSLYVWNRVHTDTNSQVIRHVNGIGSHSSVKHLWLQFI